MNVQLKPLELSDADMLYDFFQQLPASENGKYNHAHGLSSKEFSNWVKNQIDFSNGKNLPKGYVPSTTYILYINGEPIGMGDLRHYLCPSLERDGGHIGLHILPQYRGQGYGNILIQEMLRKAKEKGIKSALIFNHDDNIPAWKISEKMGGKLVSTDDVDGVKIRKYIFDMSKISY